jgi:superkiller protein 3
MERASGGNMRTIAGRFLLVLAILGFYAPLSFAQVSREPISDRELLGLVAGNVLSENVVHEIETRGLAFPPDEQFRAMVTEAGADARVIAALNSAKVSNALAAAAPENDANRQLLQHLADAGKLIRNKRYIEATRELSAALQNGGGPETGFVMGDVLRRQEEWSGAASIFMEIQRQASEFPETHTKLSYLLYRTGDGDGALREARIALAANSSNAEAHKNAALALQILNKFTASEVEYNEALRIKPDYESVRYDLGILLETQGKFDQAIVEYKKAIALDPTDSHAYYNLGVAYDDKGDLDSAIREYREAKRVDPTDIAPRHNLGNDFMKNNMNAEAVQEFRDMEAMSPGNAGCHDCLGTALFRTWDFQSAEKEFRTALKIDPSDGYAHVGLGWIREQQKDYDAALQEYHLGEELDETNVDAFRGAAKVLMAKKNFQAALEELKHAEYLKPSSFSTHDLLGQAYAGMGNYTDAVAEFKQAIALDSRQIQIRLELGDALEKSGNWVDALDQYHQAAMTNHDPDTQNQYKMAQARYDQHIATLKGSGKLLDARELEANLHAAKVDPGISEKLDALLQKGSDANIAQRFEEAFKDYKDAVDLAEKLQPQDDRLTNALMMLAGLYGRKNDFVHAEENLQQSLKVTENLHGAESPAMTMPLQNMGSYSLYRKDFNSAFDFFSRAVAINEKAYGENSDKVALSLIYLSGVFIVQQDYAKAETYLLRATHIDESIFGAESPAMNPVLSSLCDLYTRWDKPEKAEPRYRQLLAAMEKQFGPDSPVLISLLADESKTLHELGRTEEAAKVDKRLQTLRTAMGQPDGPASAQVPQ